MKYIECKAQWLSRPLTTKTAISGFEGPAAKTELDDGFGMPMVKGMLTPSYNVYFEETGREGNSTVYDGTFLVPDTKANRYKLACNIRSRDMRVKDRNLEREILGQFPPGLTREQAPKPRGIIFDMPEDFDGSKVVLRAANAAIVDVDPIEDPYAAVQDAEFTEVASPSPVLAGDAGAAAAAIAAEETAETAMKLDTVLRTSAAQAVAGQVAKPATEPAKGFDAKAVQQRAAQAKAAKPAEVKPADTQTQE